MSNVQAVSPKTSEAVFTQPAVAQSSGFNETITKKLKVPSDLNVIFEEAAQKYNVPSTLLKAVGKAESDFNVRAVSRCGAQGVMQLMPATARGLGVTDSFDPRQNIMGGAKYLSQMLQKYNGNAKLALAAYNAGSNNVDKYNGIPPFKETQNYVVKVMEYAGQNMVTTPASSKNKTTYASNVTNPVVQSGSTVARTTTSRIPGAGSSQTPFQNAYSASSDSMYNYVLDSILNFKDFTTDDYMLFIELLKSSLQSTSIAQTWAGDSMSALGLRGNRFESLF